MRAGEKDYGPNPYVTNVERDALANTDFRSAIWTGEHVQMTLMCIPLRGEIGLEMHPDTDQLLRVEHGQALVKMGTNAQRQDYEENLTEGDVAFVPAGTWHNVINTGRSPLKLSSVYAPPNHPRGTVHRTKADAEREGD